MANKTLHGRIQLKNEPSATWNSAPNFVPLKGEVIIYTDLNQVKIGDGTTTVKNLPFVEKPYTEDEITALYNAV